MIHNPSIAKTALMSLLDDATQQKLFKIGQINCYKNAQLIHARGEDKPGLSIVISGAAQVGVNGSDGVFVPVGMLGIGECFGEFTIFTELPRTHDVTAVGETEILQIPHQRFLSIYNNEPQLNTALLKLSLLRNHQLLEMLDALRRLPLLERTASILLTMSATAGTPNHLQMRQDELAFAIGVSRVSLGKELKKLVALNLVALGYGKIDFPSRSELEAWVAKHCNTTPLFWGN